MPSPPSRPFRGAVRPLYLVALVVFVLPLLASCDRLTGPGDDDLREEIEAHRAAWEARDFRDYSYRVRRNCFCSSEARGPVRIEVRNGQVAHVLDAGTGEPVPEDVRHLFPSVDGLFAVLLDAVDRGADEVEVEWDPGLGFPSRICIDYDRRVADEELGFEAADVEAIDQAAPLAPPPSGEGMLARSG